MYIIKNAFKSIRRSKGRNILMGIIILVISVSTCIGLSIREAAESAKEETLADLTITGKISVDRSAMMNNMKTGNGSNTNSDGNSDSNSAIGTDSGSHTFDKDSFISNFQNIQSLSIDEMQKYAALDSVQSFYYTMTVSMNGNDSLEAVTTTNSESEAGSNDKTTDNADNTTDKSSNNGSNSNNSNNMKPGMGENDNNRMGFSKGSMGTQGDFTVVGYSSDEAMRDFVNGTSKITEGSMFETGTEDYNCVISDELAAYNSISVGDEITIENPNNETETYTLKVVGIYNNSQSTVSESTTMKGFSTASDPANQIYLSYTALKSITTASSTNAVTSTDEKTGREKTTAIPEQVSGTYLFATAEDYDTFSKDVYTAGLSTDYVVSSSDLSSYEDSIVPLDNLSEMATYFLIVVLSIGAIVLIVLNIFSVRERKYEVGVLTAIGMKKAKVSMQFIFETLVVTFIALLLGAIIGATSSVPVTNSLLASQIEAQKSSDNQQSSSFGRDTMKPGNMPNDTYGTSNGKSNNQSMQNNGRNNMITNAKTSTDYISKVTTATDVRVLVQLLGIGICLTLVASAASVIFIMRYDPLKILANRD